VCPHDDHLQVAAGGRSSRGRGTSGKRLGRFAQRPSRLTNGTTYI
jgi:hypothetical protein